MKIEEQVVSLELAKKLKELGVKQDSHFKYCGGHTMYHDSDDGAFEVCENTDLLGDDEYCHTAGLTCEFTIAAFTVAELGEMLPARVHENENSYILTIELHGTWHVKYIHYDNGIGYILGGHPVITDVNEPDARAKLLIFLVESKLLFPTERP